MFDSEYGRQGLAMAVVAALARHPVLLDALSERADPTGFLILNSL